MFYLYSKNLIWQDGTIARTIRTHKDSQWSAVQSLLPINSLQII